MSGQMYMRYDDLASHKHQVVHAYPCPFSTATALLAAVADAELSAHLSASVEKEPDVIALLDFTCAPGDVGAVVEDEGDDDIGGFDSFLHRQKLLPQLLPCLGLSEQSRFRHGFGNESDFGVGSQTPFRFCGLAIRWRRYSGRLDDVGSRGSRCYCRRGDLDAILGIFFVVYGE